MEDFFYVLYDDSAIGEGELLLLMPNHPRDLHVGLPYFALNR